MPYQVWSMRCITSLFRLKSNLGRDTLFHRIAGLTRSAVSAGHDRARLVEHRREGQHRDVADDRQRDSDAEADERKLGAIRAVRRVDVAQGCQDGASRATEQTGEQVARLLGTGQFRLPRHEHLVVLVLHHVTPIHKRVGGEPNRAPPPTLTCNHPQERMCRHHSTLSSAPVRIPVLRVPAAGILDGALARMTHDLGTLV